MFTSVFTLSFAVVISVFARHAESESVLRDSGEITLPVEGPEDLSCYDSLNKPYIKDLPHPDNCNFFVKCQERLGAGPAPLQVQCQPGLHFDLNDCRCEEPGQALCFQPEHEHMRMNCACPLIDGPDGYLIPDMSDKRCQNGFENR